MDALTTLLVLLALLVLVLLWLGVFLFILLKAKWPNWLKLVILIPAGFSAIPVFFVVMYVFFFRPYQVSGDAMLPTYPDGAYLLARLYAGKIERGDVIVFRAPIDLEKEFIKRVVGLPGETITVKNKKIYINNVELSEAYTRSPWADITEGDLVKESQEYVVPADSYFVLGDNRPSSSDSRNWGFVTNESIRGKIILCYAQCNFVLY